MKINTTKFIILSRVKVEQKQLVLFSGFNFTQRLLK